MATLYITPNDVGGVTLTEICGEDVGGVKLTKTLFELSRTTDLETHFDAAVHTRETIAAGIAGHRALALTAECEDSDLPSNTYFRKAWEWRE